MIPRTFRLALIAWLVGCNAVAAAADAPRLFALDPAESRVWFDADARLQTFRGETQQLTGRFTLLQRSPPQVADATVTIAAGGLSTGHPGRDADMRRDFLEVERFPTIEFQVEDILTPPTTTDRESWDLVLQGKLTIHGVTRDIRVPTTVHMAQGRITAHGQVYLDMQTYNIRVPRLLFIPMKSEVLVGFDVAARPVQ